MSVVTVGCGGEDGGGGGGDGGEVDAGRPVDAGGGRPRDAGNPSRPPPPTTSVECGTATCTAPDTMGFLAIEACCVDEETNTCGLSMAGEECVALVEADPRCDGVEFSGFVLASCCTGDGQCGIDATAFGMSCISLAEAAQGAMSRAMGSGVELPKPKRCDGTDGSGEADAGSELDGGVPGGDRDAGRTDGGETPDGGADSATPDSGETLDAGADSATPGRGNDASD